MTLLDAVRWPELVVDLVDGSSDQSRAAAVHYAASRDVERAFRRGVAFAAIVCPQTMVQLRAAVSRTSNLDVDQAERVAMWLCSTAPIVLRLATAAMAAPMVAAQPGQLMVDPALPDLPLLPLAADLAARMGGLAVVAVDMPPGIGGCHTTDRTIRLDRNDPARYWPHELAHYADPALGQRGDPALDERFADLLGTLLLSYLPTSVLAAAEYVDLALAEVSTQQAEQAQGAGTGEGQDLPAPGTESVLAFCALPLVAAQ